MTQTTPPNLSLTPSAELEQLLDGPQILIVDDETVVGDLCAQALSHCRITQASGAHSALELIAKTDFDLILTDINMPDMGGLELLRTIKEAQPNKPVIIMTGYACKETILEALKADADDFISKPFNLLHLQTTINKTLEKKALKEELLQLQQMDKLKTDFLGMISHKLNNPVTAISLFFQNIDHGAINLNDPTFKEYLDLMKGESDNLVNLISSLLLYTEMALNDSPLEKAPVDLCKLTREVIAEAQQQLDNREILLSTKCPEASQPIPLDRSRIKFVIRALLDNAINACSSGDTINTNLSIDAAQATLTITDPGAGIPAAEQTKIFEKFYQVESSPAARSKGFGLGLYYARLFTRMHDGTLSLKSSPKSGTSATITLPF